MNVFSNIEDKITFSNIVESAAIIHEHCHLNNNGGNIKNFTCKYELNDTLIPNNNALIPDISFIIATRNDGYGGNPLQRLRFTLQQIILYPWFKTYNLIVEIIIVEWNTDNEYGYNNR